MVQFNLQYSNWNNSGSIWSWWRYLIFGGEFECGLWSVHIVIYRDGTSSSYNRVIHSNPIMLELKHVKKSLLKTVERSLMNIHYVKFELIEACSWCIGSGSEGSCAYACSLHITIARDHDFDMCSCRVYLGMAYSQIQFKFWIQLNRIELDWIIESTHCFLHWFYRLL
jgi:hypothetical protein